MASVEECRAAVDRLAELLAGVDPALRARHVPDRSLACRVTDLDVVFSGRIDPDGVHDVVQGARGDDAAADVRVAVSSDRLVALSVGDDDLLHAWLRGRVQISAPIKDILRLRSLLSL